MRILILIYLFKSKLDSSEFKLDKSKFKLDRGKFSYSGDPNKRGGGGP